MIQTGSQMLNFEERFSSFLQTDELEILNKEFQLKDLFNLAIERFNEIYHFANQAVDKMKSKEFSILVKNSETLMLAAERISKIIFTKDIEDQINDLKVKFEELFQKIPLGDSVLLQRDIDNMKKMLVTPKNLTYVSKWGEFYEPQINTHNVTVFFQDFCYQNNYLSINVIDKLDTYYKYCVKTMMTVVAFRKKNKKPSRFWNLISSFNPPKNEKQKQLNELTKLVENQYRKWRYKRFEIMHVEDMTHCKFENHQIEIDEWGWYVFLYHRNVNDDDNLAIPVDEEQIQDLDNDTRIVELQESNDNASSMTVDSVTLFDEDDIQEKPLAKTKNKRSKSLKVTLQRFFKKIYLSIKNFIMRLFQCIKKNNFVDSKLNLVREP